jgi:hypothetical protein
VVGGVIPSLESQICNAFAGIDAGYRACEKCRERQNRLETASVTAHVLCGLLETHLVKRFVHKAKEGKEAKNRADKDGWRWIVFEIRFPEVEFISDETVPIEP